jgi:hypothetical protein
MTDLAWWSPRLAEMLAMIFPPAARLAAGLLAALCLCSCATSYIGVDAGVHAATAVPDTAGVASAE